MPLLPDNFRILTDWQLQALVSQAAAATYILELRATIGRMIDDHGRTAEALLAQVRELRDQVGMLDRLRRTPAVEGRLSTVAASAPELTYEPIPDEVPR